MRITEVRIKLVNEDEKGRLKAFCSIALDDALVIHDLKIINGYKGIFVAMPNRRIIDHCLKCGCSNHLLACFCNQCGERIYGSRIIYDANGRGKLYADIAHPISSAFREVIQSTVLKFYNEEKKLSEQPGYVCRYDDYFQVNQAL